MLASVIGLRQSYVLACQISNTRAAPMPLQFVGRRRRGPVVLGIHASACSLYAN